MTTTSGTDPRPDPADLADAVAAAVRAVPGVDDLHAGALGEVATYLPGRRVGGVRLLEPGCAVSVVLGRAASLATTTQAVRDAVRPLTGLPVHVTVEDIASTPAEEGTTRPPA